MLEAFARGVASYSRKRAREARGGVEAVCHQQAAHCSRCGQRQRAVGRIAISQRELAVAAVAAKPTSIPIVLDRFECKLRHLERVKWYRPHVRHIVADIECRPSSSPPDSGHLEFVSLCAVNTKSSQAPSKLPVAAAAPTAKEAPRIAPSGAAVIRTSYKTMQPTDCVLRSCFLHRASPTQRPTTAGSSLGWRRHHPR